MHRLYVVLEVLKIGFGRHNDLCTHFNLESITNGGIDRVYIRRDAIVGDIY